MGQRVPDLYDMYWRKKLTSASSEPLFKATIHAKNKKKKTVRTRINKQANTKDNGNQV